MNGAIETEYRGIRFRSRLEARWAVFFDVAGIEWKYETEGYEVDGHRYLPDFWLPDSKVWVEVKGDPAETEMVKASQSQSQHSSSLRSEEVSASALGIPAGLLADYLVVRKAKKVGKLTETAAEMLRREADKAGISQQQGWSSKRPVAPSLVMTALGQLLEPLGFVVRDLRWRPDGSKPHDGERAQRLQRQAEDFVYFLSAGPFIKIGKTSGSPDSRIRELQTGCPFRIELVAHTTGGMKRERELHRRFAALRSHGEWFRNEGPLAEYVKALAEEQA